MLEIRSNHLRVELLDPNADHSAHGNRYCRGAYIWQVYDNEDQALLSGPEYPEPNPTSFNGQGLPDVFRSGDKSGNNPLTQRADGTGLIIGVGRASGGFTPQSVAVEEALQWQVQVEAEQAVFSCAQEVADWSYQLQRTVSVQDRQVFLINELHNTGDQMLPLQWYAHPFFQHRNRDNRTTVAFHHPIGIESSPGFDVDDQNILRMRTSAEWDQAGHFAWFELEENQQLDASISHPLLDEVRIVGDFPMEMMPVWANCNTLSIEPYLRQDIAPGEHCRWSLTFTFGESRQTS